MNYMIQPKRRMCTFKC